MSIASLSGFYGCWIYYVVLAFCRLVLFYCIYSSDDWLVRVSFVLRIDYRVLLKFPSWTQATIGIDFLSKTMYLEDRTVRLQLWYGDCCCIC